MLVNQFWSLRHTFLSVSPSIGIVCFVADLTFCSSPRNIYPATEPGQAEIVHRLACSLVIRVSHTVPYGSRRLKTGPYSRPVAVAGRRTLPRYGNKHRDTTELKTGDVRLVRGLVTE